ncbi:MAG TPA: lysyl oxidase family protein [Vicinamibacteria bacterium]|nr:lysyl oxidase family protein [Vicinamibacteria bacterium]
MGRATLATLGAFVLASGLALGQRTSVSSDFPIYDNGGKPDFTVDPKRFVSQMEIVDRLFEPGDCELEEGTVGGTGYRRLLRFDTVIINAGDGDLLVGDPTDPSGLYYGNFEFAACHGHYHNRGFSDYKLLNLDRTVAAPGHKQAFCLEDNLRYTNGAKRQFVTCGYQGLSSGFGDWYYKQLSGQWIDITGVPEGDYVVQVRVNAIGLFDEGANRYPSVIEARVHVPDPRKKVTVDDSPLLQAK